MNSRRTLLKSLLGLATAALLPWRKVVAAPVETPPAPKPETFRVSIHGERQVLTLPSAVERVSGVYHEPDIATMTLTTKDGGKWRVISDNPNGFWRVYDDNPATVQLPGRLVSAHGWCLRNPDAREGG